MAAGAVELTAGGGAKPVGDSLGRDAGYIDRIMRRGLCDRIIRSRRLSVMRTILSSWACDTAGGVCAPPAGTVGGGGNAPNCIDYTGNP